MQHSLRNNCWLVCFILEFTQTEPEISIPTVSIEPLRARWVNCAPTGSPTTHLLADLSGAFLKIYGLMIAEYYPETGSQVLTCYPSQ